MFLIRISSTLTCYSFTEDYIRILQFDILCHQTAFVTLYPNKNGRNHYTQLAFFNSTTPTNKVFWPSKILLLQLRIEKCTFEENYDAFVIFTMCRSLWQTRLNENWMAKETSMVHWIQMLK
jgi:hypothetical protein